MPEEAPVNIGALLERPYTVRQRVLGIQTKLHSWAAADPGRCFDDLFNLVVDLGFLVMAWTRVREKPAHQGHPRHLWFSLESATLKQGPQRRCDPDAQRDDIEALSPDAAAQQWAAAIADF